MSIGNNPVEIVIRSFVLGGENWLFCWAEPGAENVGIIQRSITSCRLHGINVYIDLTDVRLRINIHPAGQVAGLTPRLCKENYADNPLSSDLWLGDNPSAE